MATVCAFDVVCSHMLQVPSWTRHCWWRRPVSQRIF